MQFAQMKDIEARRAQIIERVADHILANGLSASSLRPLAKAAGTSDRMLLYYFADKAEIVGAALDIVARRMIETMESHKSAERMPLAALQAVLLDIVLADALWPYMRVWMEIALRAAQGDAYYRVVGEQIGRGFFEWGASQIDGPTAAERNADAARLLITIEGMMLLKSIGMDDLRRYL